MPTMETKKKEKGGINNKSFIEKCKMMVTASFVAFVVSLVALIMAVLFAIHSQSRSPTKETVIHKESNCINCAQLLNEYRNSYSEGNLENSENFGKPCCSENGNELAQILEKVMHVQETKSTNKLTDHMSNENPKLTAHQGPVLAHKSFFYSLKVNGICKANTDLNHDDMRLITFSETENDPVEVVKQIKIIKDGLQIIFPGMYYVYSSVKFQNKEKQTKNLTWNECVYRERNNKCDRLLKSTHTVCQDCSESKDTAFTGGVFYLLKGDVIRVLISEQGLNDYNVKNSFLGALMLSAK